MRKLIVPALAALLLAGGYWALKLANRPEVLLVEPTRGMAIRAIYATGVVEPEHWAAVAPLDGGRIVAVLAYETAEVVAGEPLARLDDAEAVAVIEELEARRDYLETEVERTARLVGRGFVSEKAHERALSEHREILAALAGARARRDHMTLRAPVSGQVLRRDGEIGEVIERGQPVYWVGAPSPLRIQAEVDEEDIPAVRPGQLVKIKADAFPDRALDGTVSEITPKGDPLNKSFRVRIALPDETPLMIGMTTETNIVVEERPDALLVPASAVMAGAVWAVRDGRAARLPVTVGVVGSFRTEILDGLGDGQPIIAAPPHGLEEGTAVRVVAPGT